MLAETNGWDFAIYIVPLTVASIAGWWKLRNTANKAEVAAQSAEVAKATGEEVRDAIGVPNGNGNLVQMQSRTLGYLAELLKWKEQQEQQGFDQELRRHDFANEMRRLYTDLAARVEKLENT